ncbi:hypothetical protein PGT21_017425 [Puccinia graminis f. sp. tritici]|uniref:No apical meristem-associated C-terminal domain-containing protein n=1 Tax=Puccinia graminis f. sp. tritici TaxID=56615 RepID=A0A5B0RGV1_PUCGR|nr:hypothetical protein PGT21_017425 [Puccinia graminis f. sp. tritici]KAA1124672.1 hypothetical protein PGTUg99_028138 [Puccinia graminis f. sp. tritici]
MSTTNSKAQTSGLTAQEDEQLAHGWLEASKSFQGQPKKHGLWAAVTAQFNEHTSSSPREEAILHTRWLEIQQHTRNFSVYYNQAKRNAPSGRSEIDLIRAAKDAYLALNYRAFEFEPAWNVLRLHPEWMDQRAIEFELPAKASDDVLLEKAPVSQRSLDGTDQGARERNASTSNHTTQADLRPTQTTNMTKRKRVQEHCSALKQPKSRQEKLAEDKKKKQKEDQSTAPPSVQKENPKSVERSYTDIMNDCAEINLFLADQKVLEQDLNLLTDDLAREYFELKRKEIQARRHAKYPQFFSPPSSSIP